MALRTPFATTWIFAAAAAAAAVLVGTGVARAEFPTTRPYPRVTYLHAERTDPPQQVHAVVLDLAGDGVSLRVAPGGPDPDGPGKWQTTLLPTSEIAEREGFDVAVNGDFFAVTAPATQPEKKGYVRDMWATVSGPAATDGRQWAEPANPRPSLVVGRNGRVAIQRAKDVPDGARHVVAGSDIVVERGRNVAKTEGSFAVTRHPRTAVGIADGGRKLVVVVVDGRQKGRAAGMTLSELADAMLELGCESALNLDGGGSTTLVMRDPESGQVKVVNRPSGGAQRAVANVLGATVSAPANGRRPATRPGRD